RLDVAHELARRLPATLRLLESGTICYPQARALAEAVASLDGATAVKVEERVLARAGQQSLAQFRRSVARAVAAVDPARVEQQHQDAMAERRVCLTPREDGMAELWALLPAAGAAAVM